LSDEANKTTVISELQPRVLSADYPFDQAARYDTHMVLQIELDPYIGIERKIKK
jgi:hypothetical protein